MTVIGYVESVAVKQLNKSRSGTVTFINFGRYTCGAFTIIAWDKAGRDLAREIGDPTRLEGRWVSITGLLTVFRNKKLQLDSPQVELRSARALDILSAGEARRRLTGGAATSTARWHRPVASTPPKTSGSTAAAHSTTVRLQRGLGWRTCRASYKLFAVQSVCTATTTDR